MGRAFNMDEAAEFHIRNGKSVEDFKDSVLAEMRKRNENPIQTAAPAKLDMPEAEDREYSVMRAIRVAVAKDWSNAGLEKEASDTIAKRLNRPTTGFFLPADLKHRDMTAGTATEGAELVGRDHCGDLFVDALCNRLVMQALGAVVLDDLQSDVEIPKLTASANVQWVAENTAGTEQTRLRVTSTYPQRP